MGAGPYAYGIVRADWWAIGSTVVVHVRTEGASEGLFPLRGLCGRFMLAMRCVSTSCIGYPEMGGTRRFHKIWWTLSMRCADLGIIQKMMWTGYECTDCPAVAAAEASQPGSSTRIGGVGYCPRSLNLGAHCGDDRSMLKNRKRLFAAGNLPSKACPACSGSDKM